MKITEIFIFVCLLFLIYSECIPEEDELVKIGKIRDYRDCESRTMDQELVENNAYKCCHLRYTVDSKNYYADVYTCTYITQNQYDNIKDTVKEYERVNDVVDVEIDCKSYYLQLGLLSILLFLF